MKLDFKKIALLIALRRLACVMYNNIMYDNIDMTTCVCIANSCCTGYYCSR